MLSLRGPANPLSTGVARTTLTRTRRGDVGVRLVEGVPVGAVRADGARLAELQRAFVVAMPSAPALSAHPASARPAVGICGVVRMAFGTMRHLPRESAPCVLPRGDGLQVGGVHAATISTQVVDLKSIGNRPDEQHVTHAVSVLSGPRASDAVAVLPSRTSPLPAARFHEADMRGEPFVGVCHPVILRGGRVAFSI